MTKKHQCKDHWLWENIAGVRLYREEERGKRTYRVRCSMCNRSSVVDSKGEPIPLEELRSISKG